MSTLLLWILFSFSIYNIHSEPTCNHGSDQMYICSALNQLSANSISNTISYAVDYEGTTYSYSHLTASPTSNLIQFGNYTSCFAIPSNADYSSSILQSCHTINGVSSDNDPLCMYHINKIAPLGFVKCIIFLSPSLSISPSPLICVQGYITPKNQKIRAPKLNHITNTKKITVTTNTECAIQWINWRICNLHSIYSQRHLYQHKKS